MKNNDIEKSFIEMIRLNDRIIYKVCSFYISSDRSLEDLYQEVVSNLWIGYPKFRHESSISTWIYRVALNTCISELRKGKNKPKNVAFAELQDAFIQPEDMTAKIEEMYSLIYQLKKLERAVILLYLEEKSYQKIATITGLTVNNVAVKLKRIKEKLVKMSNQ